MSSDTPRKCDTTMESIPNHTHTKHVTFARVFWAFTLAPIGGLFVAALCDAILTNLLTSGYYTITWNNTLGYYAYTNTWIPTTPTTGIAIVSLLLGFLFSTGLTIALLTA